MTSIDLEALRAVAVRAAAAGAEVVRAWRDREAPLHAATKAPGDYVTAADRAAEEAVLRVLREATPHIPLLAEESGGERSAALLWVVDPLDGTTNFVRAFPVVGVSVGLLAEGRPVAGAVEAPLLGARWSAARGLGAVDGAGRPLRVARGHGRGVAATGFPFRRPENRGRYLAVFERALAAFEDLRRAGAASLDLAYSAQGTFDGFFELGLSIWDIAAGALLVEEAGGVVTDWSGDAGAVWSSGDIVAGAPAWHERLLDLCRAAAADGATVAAE